jgi:hypothetical protein
VLPSYTVRGSVLYVVHAAARVLPAKIAAFRDFVLQHCSGNSLASRPAVDPVPATRSYAERKIGLRSARSR